MHEYILNYGLYETTFDFHGVLKFTDKENFNTFPNSNLQNLFPNHNAIKLKINTKSFSTIQSRTKKPRERKNKNNTKNKAQT